jgi:CheY-like chemotaxis protein
VYEQVQRQSLEAGCNAFIAKPINITGLLELLKNLLGIEYIFKEPQLPEPSTAQIVYPPAQTLKEILELLLIGDVRGTEQKITRLEQTDPCLKPFADKVLSLTRNFKIDEAYQYLQSLALTG